MLLQKNFLFVYSVLENIRTTMVFFRTSAYPFPGGVNVTLMGAGRQPSLRSRVRCWLSNKELGALFGLRSQSIVSDQNCFAFGKLIQVKKHLVLKPFLDGPEKQGSHELHIPKTTIQNELYKVLRLQAYKIQIKYMK